VNKDYWDNYYKSRHTDIEAPSSFAIFVFENYLKHRRNSFLIDVGCGNGRDSFFFLEKGLPLLGIDACEVAIKNNQSKAVEKQISNGNFLSLRVREIESLMPTMEKAKNKEIWIHSRFFLHAIEEFEYIKFIEFLSLLKTGSLIAFEFRTNKDELFSKQENKIGNISKTGHYRRFLDFREVVQFLEQQGYSINYQIESKDISVVGNDNPVLGRIIGEKC